MRRSKGGREFGVGVQAQLESALISAAFLQAPCSIEKCRELLWDNNGVWTYNKPTYDSDVVAVVLKRAVKMKTVPLFTCPNGETHRPTA